MPAWLAVAVIVTVAVPVVPPPFRVSDASAAFVSAAVPTNEKLEPLN